LKNFKILVYAERNSGEVHEGYNPFSRGASICEFRKKNCSASEPENKLLEHCIIMDQRYYALRRQDIKRMAFQLAIRNGLKHAFNQEKSEAGKKLLRFFLKRHPLISLRTPEGISAARVKGFTSENVARIFFCIYESELRKVNHPVHRIFNVCDTGITNVQHGHTNIVSMKVKKNVVSLTSAVLSPV
jgi:hypothetical protein